MMTVLSVTAFASCSGDITESDGTTEQPENPGTPEDPDNPDGQDGQDAPDTPSGESNILVAYFSWSGNTQRMAQQIVSQTGADLFRIVELTPGAEAHLDGLGLTSGRLNDGTNVENWLHEIGMIK